ncbi:MAG: YggS family pyridoxal phosphate-dependent enzyme [Rhodothermales bacterium]
METTSTDVDASAIAERLAAVRERIAAACERAGRPASSVTLVAVSKTFPLAAVEAAYAAGARHFGENKVQDLVEKAEAMPGQTGGGDLCWHMIGHLQRNKAKDVVAHADLFEALDSPRLAKELNKRAEAEERVVPCLVQVNVSGEESKYGLGPDHVHDFLDQVAAYEGLRVRGLMTLAAPADDSEDVRPQFELLRRLAETYPGNARAGLDVLSMGMSGDFEVAIEEGATHVRIGSAIFGPRG